MNLKQFLFKALLLLTIIPLFFCCESNAKKSTDYFNRGYIEDNTYYNSFFNLKLPLPKNWHIMNDGELELLAESSALIKNEKIEKHESEDFIDNTLISIFKYGLLDAQTYNYNFTLLANKIIGVKNGKEAVNELTKILKQQNPNIQITHDDSKAYNFGGKTFFSFDAEQYLFNQLIKQSFYITVYRSYAISIVLTYQTNEQKKELAKFIKNISFEE